MAFHSVDPIGELRGDLRTGLLSAMVARGLGSKTAKPQDFLIGFDGTDGSGRRKMSVAEMQANLLAAAKGRVRYARRNGQEGNRST